MKLIILAAKIRRLYGFQFLYCVRYVISGYTPNEKAHRLCPYLWLPVKSVADSVVFQDQGVVGGVFLGIADAVDVVARTMHNHEFSFKTDCVARSSLIELLQIRKVLVHDFLMTFCAKISK